MNGINRLNNKWEKDEAMASIYADNAQAFCNVKNDCFKVNNVCSTTDLAESEIKKVAIFAISSFSTNVLSETIDS